MGHGQTGQTQTGNGQEAIFCLSIILPSVAVGGCVLAWGGICLEILWRQSRSIGGVMAHGMLVVRIARGVVLRSAGLPGGIEEYCLCLSMSVRGPFILSKLCRIS